MAKDDGGPTGVPAAKKAEAVPKLAGRRFTGDKKNSSEESDIDETTFLDKSVSSQGGGKDAEAGFASGGAIPRLGKDHLHHTSSHAETGSNPTSALDLKPSARRQEH